MWGYIDEKVFISCAVGVPSLYVRVYRISAPNPQRPTGSLIICEGISYRKGAADMRVAFPHYMWGYIDMFSRGHLSIEVPSLYVRVYRSIYSSGTGQIRSLIICEGISHFMYINQTKGGFPHYMWGYILLLCIRLTFRAVPSLYVRVYRLSDTVLAIPSGSLIICEGISEMAYSWHSSMMFPHYMWGYIGDGDFLKGSGRVPSLYVRVYHPARKCGRGDGCSLIICEDISLCFGHNVPFGKVPSLYVMVYRDRMYNLDMHKCSLIICECISKLAMASFRHQKI